MSQQTLIIITFSIYFIASLVIIFFLILKKQQPKAQNTSFLANNLADEKQKSNIIINTIEDGIILIDPKGVIQLFNPGASNLTGWQDSDAIGLDYKSIIKLVNDKNEPYDNSNDPVLKLNINQHSYRDNTATLVSKNNLQIAVSISTSAFFDQNGKISGNIMVIRDITKERLEEKQRTEFISTASHEMRTPVAAIEGYLSLSLNEKVSTIDNRARDYLEKAYESTRHLGQLFQDLLTSAKAEDGRLTSHPVIIQLSEYLEKLSQDLKFAAEKKNLTISFVTGEPDDVIDATKGSHNILPLYYIKADPDRIREVITNLFDNAVKYTEQGVITLGLRGDNNIVQIYVKDMGIGIPKEDIPHLFQKFYRVDNSATRTIGGTGLGLFIAQKIVELYQGKIWVESTINKGSTFYINFPRIDTVTAQNELRNQINEINV